MHFEFQFMFCSNRCSSSVEKILSKRRTRRELSQYSRGTTVNLLFKWRYSSVPYCTLNISVTVKVRSWSHQAMFTVTVRYRHLNGKSTVVPCEYCDEFINRFVLKDCSTLCSRDLFISKNIRRVRRNNIHNSLSYLSGTRIYKKVYLNWKWHFSSIMMRFMSKESFVKT